MSQPRRSLRLAALIAALAIGAVGRAAAQPDPPELTGPVNDFAGVIDPASEQSLETLSRQLQSASGDVVVVATVKTFQPWGDLRSFANKMFENRGRGIGQKGRDNGMLVVLAVDDRQVWVETGYDIEGLVTDGFAGETSREVMAPFFRQGQYGQGLVAGTTRLVQRIAEGRNVTLQGVPQVAAPARRRGGIPFIVWIVLALVVINLLSGRRGRRGRRRWYGHVGPFGGGFGGWTAGGGGWSSGSGGFGGGFGGFGGGRSGGGGGGASW